MPRAGLEQIIVLFGSNEPRTCYSFLASIIKYRYALIGVLLWAKRQKNIAQREHYIEIILIFALQKEPKVVGAPQSVKREFGENPRQYQLL